MEALGAFIQIGRMKCAPVLNSLSTNWRKSGIDSVSFQHPERYPSQFLALHSFYHIYAFRFSCELTINKVVSSK